MFNALKAARRKYRRDRRLPLPLLARKSARYLWELASAPVYLLFVNQVGEGVRTLGKPRIENLGHMIIGPNCLLRSVGTPVELATGLGAHLMIGAEVSIDGGASIGCTGNIYIGNRVRIGAFAMIVDTDFHDAYNRSIRPAPNPVTIEDDVWIGAKASILSGVHIGRGAVIGTGAVVTKDVPAYTVVEGVPARVVRTLDPNRMRTQEMASDAP